MGTLVVVNANRLEKVDKPPRGLFVVGTDTEVGKTYVACLLASHLAYLGNRVGVYKPVASGCDGMVPNDAELLRKACGTQWPLEQVCPQQFARPLAPPLAAQLEGRAVDKNKLIDGAKWWHDRCDVLVIEGAGGVLSPIASDWTVLDFAQRIRMPLLLVAPNRLGVVNHVLLAIEAATRRDLSVTTVVLNQLSASVADSSAEWNGQLIEQFAPQVSVIPISYGAQTWPHMRLEM